jgi:hypothetical protein
MVKDKTYENYPITIPLLAVFLSFFTYILGAYIISGIDIIFAIIYLVYCIILELSIILRSCKDCYYYGKVCGLGKGKIAPWFIKKGNTERFKNKKISLIQILPDFLVGIIPIAVGIYLLIQDFSWLILALIIIIFLISFVGAGVTRGQLFCKYCKQREIGCPAEQLFNKKGGK